MVYNIGVIGKGFVGSAVEYGFTNLKKNKFNVRIFDTKTELCTNSFEDTVNFSDIIFISVPTPSNLDGSINLDIVDKLLQDIEIIYNGQAIILLRSTVVPGTTADFQKKYSKLKIVFNPEFLTEANANEDFVNQDRIILGGQSENVNYVEKFYQTRFGSSIPIIKTNYQTAEMIKYMNNCFLAAKVSFMNEMKQLSEKSEVDWTQAVNGFLMDSRIGKSHYSVLGQMVNLALVGLFSKRR